MNETEQCCNATAGPGYKPGLFIRTKHRLQRWAYLNIWCRHFYRPVMRLMHRFNLHHAPPSQLSPPYGKRDHWCQWCGLRGHTWTYDPNAPLNR